ncbi:MAG: murein L,D-transpeptidase catalytic domain family protein [Tannerella sp.]|nr:murein L,D-transpeptidase catalytic domain family protein [Tannerella sp.]
MSCFFVIACVSCLRQQAPATGQGAEKDSLSLASFPGKSPKADALQEHLRLKADSAGVYCRSRGFSERYCILVNFNIHSGKKRFFVWDFEKDTVLYASLCAHGTGRESTPKKPVYSNDPGSYCSSLGRYKTGVSSYSRYGIHIHYKLHGLDPTNNNAFKRIIVLHSHSPMPDREIYPLYLPLGYSLGCPVISDPVMRKVDTLLKESKKPVLLWIYDEPVIYIHTE